MPPAFVAAANRHFAVSRANRRFYLLLGWTYCTACALLIVRARAEVPASDFVDGSSSYAAPSASETEWFRRVKPYCNAVEVATLDQRATPPSTVAGAGYHAACFALAGRIDDARRIIDRLPADDRYNAPYGVTHSFSCHPLGVPSIV